MPWNHSKAFHFQLFCLKCQLAEHTRSSGTKMRASQLWFFIRKVVLTLKIVFNLNLQVIALITMEVPGASTTSTLAGVRRTVTWSTIARRRVFVVSHPIAFLMLCWINLLKPHFVKCFKQQVDYYWCIKNWNKFDSWENGSKENFVFISDRKIRQPDCRKTKYGCCWDNKTAKTSKTGVECPGMQHRFLSSLEDMGERWWLRRFVHRYAWHHIRWNRDGNSFYSVVVIRH